MTKTVLVTGATGYIAKHLCLQLLEAGYHVVGSARSLKRGAELRATLETHISDPALLENLRIVELDLSTDDGWATAMSGVDVLMHTASPFPLTQPKDEEDVIRPAVDGALRAVKAARAAGIHRVIMTSSSVAVMSSDLPPGQSVYDETNWTELTHPTANAYVKSKTLAEKAVWDWHAQDAPEMQITMINPSLVLGTPLDQDFGTSVQVVERVMRGTDPMLPQFGFPCVDVGDIVLMHIRAMERPESIGKRFIGAERFLWYADMAEILKAQHPDRKISSRKAPNFMIRFLSLFDPSIRTIVPVLGLRTEVTSKQAQDILGIDFRDVTQSLRETGAFLDQNGLA